ncbi:MAG: hypothetical protein A2X36_15455 [Elusimicrobia bacterium GWA2_69_24]|nr:MAG: hypothetical protein A2X36_15455 [Elusimicrobia bacterium GWA2_69_24]
MLGLAAAGPLRAEGSSGPSLARRPVLEAVFQNLGRLAELRKTLDLSAEQQEKLQELFRSRRPEVLKAVRAVRDGREKVLAAVRADKPDDAAIRKAVAALTGPLTEAALLRARVRREALVLLTPKQRTQVDDFMGTADARMDSAFQELEAK